MSFSFASFFVTLVALFGLVLSAPLAQRDARDVYVPPVLYPKNGTVWHSGSRHNVTWDISSPPAQITNKVGKIVLATDGLLDLDNPLAENFNILTGRQEITVPHVASPGPRYEIILFGDSGNSGGVFTIL